MVYVELPEVGDDVTKGEAFGVVESVKVRMRSDYRRDLLDHYCLTSFDLSHIGQTKSCEA